MGTAAGQPVAIGADLQRRRGGTSDHRPSQGRPGRCAINAVGNHLDPVGAGRRIADDDPLRVVLAGSGGMLAAGADAAIAASVQPQVQIVQHGAAQGVRRGLVPSQHQVEAAGVRRHFDILPSVFAVARFGDRAAAHPAIRLIAIQHAGASRHLAQPELSLQGARSVGVAGGEPGRHMQPSIWLDGAGHQPRPHQGRLLFVRGRRIHQQGDYSGHGRRGHAGAALGEIFVGAAIALDRPHRDARRDHLGRQTPVGSGAAAAEGGQFAAIVYCAHR